MLPLYLFVLLPLLAGMTGYLFCPGKWFIRTNLLVQSFLFGFGIVLFVHIRNHGTLIHSIGGWPQTVGIWMRADLLSCVLLLLAVLLFASVLVFGYEKPYFDKTFLLLLMVWQSLILGLLLSNDLFNIYILIDIGTIVVTLLILYKREKRSYYDGMMFLLLNMAAAAFFLLGIGFLYRTTGVLDLYAIAQKIRLLDDPSALIVPYTLIMTGVCFKAALIPLFTWLPKAHGTPGAPSVVSAILSGVYVKVGIYLFIRLREAFGEVIQTDTLFIGIAFLTGTAGFLLAVCQDDIKQILAYSTISQIGLITLAISSGYETAYWGGVYHILSHAFFKTVLFLTAGMIIDAYGTRDIRRISGVLRSMPVTGAATLLSVLGVTGAPLLSGSYSKYFIYYGFRGGIMEYGLIFLNFGTILVFVRYAVILFGKAKEQPGPISAFSNAVVAFLGALCFLGGLFSPVVKAFLFGQTVTIDISDYLWKAVIYLISLLAGLAVYRWGILKIPRFVERCGTIKLGFNSAAFMLVLFGILLMVYLSLKYSALF